MARSGRKIILLEVKDPADIEFFINLAEKKGKGLHFNYHFKATRGLEMEVMGPRDQINNLEYILRTAWRQMYKS